MLQYISSTQNKRYDKKLKVIHWFVTRDFKDKKKTPIWSRESLKRKKKMTWFHGSTPVKLEHLCNSLWYIYRYNILRIWQNRLLGMNKHGLLRTRVRSPAKKHEKKKKKIQIRGKIYRWYRLVTSMIERVAGVIICPKSVINYI